MELNINRITNLLEERGVSIRKLSQVIGISPSGLDNALKVGSLRADLLGKIAEFLNVNIDEFYEGENPKSARSSLYLEQRIELLEKEVEELKTASVSKKN